jgi:hypothetical protein
MNNAKVVGIVLLTIVGVAIAAYLIRAYQKKNGSAYWVAVKDPTKQYGVKWCTERDANCQCTKSTTVAHAEDCVTVPCPGSGRTVIVYPIQQRYFYRMPWRGRGGNWDGRR